MTIFHQLPKAISVSHLKDVDGCVCASLIRCATNSDFLLTNYGDIKKYLRNIGQKYDVVYFCDLGINDSLLEEFGRIRKFAELIYIDHHPINKKIKERLDEMGVKTVHDKRECASILTFNFFQESLPREAGLMASYAAFDDRLENGPISRELIGKYDRDFILFETTILSYGLKEANLKLKRKIVRDLSDFKYPHQIEGITKLAIKQADRIIILRKEIPHKASKLKNIAYCDAEGESTSTIANLLLDVCEANIGIGYNKNDKEQITDISIRCRSDINIDLGKVTSKLAVKLGGFGGGHPRASGARIPTSKLKIFIRNLSKM